MVEASTHVPACGTDANHHRPSKVHATPSRIVRFCVWALLALGGCSALQPRTVVGEYKSCNDWMCERLMVSPDGCFESWATGEHEFPIVRGTWAIEDRSCATLHRLRPSVDERTGRTGAEEPDGILDLCFEDERIELTHHDRFEENGNLAVTTLSRVSTEARPDAARRGARLCPF